MNTKTMYKCAERASVSNTISCKIYEKVRFVMNSTTIQCKNM